jgi:hypothetical protein
MQLIEAQIAPYVRDRGYDWEIHIDETPSTLAGAGFGATDALSEGEKLWVEKTVPSPTRV